VNLTHRPVRSELADSGTDWQAWPRCSERREIGWQVGLAPEIKSGILNSKLVELVLLERIPSQGLKN
jgi:hypothetical protein